MTSLIDIIGVSKSYREGDQTHVVLDDIDASIAPGELVVLLGRSGLG